MTSTAEIPAAVRRIIEAAVRAPSAENHHMLRFSVAHDRIVVKATDEYRSASSQKKLLAWLSHGAVIENICIQATAEGLEARADIYPSQHVVCEVTLEPLRGSPDRLAEAIPDRHTNRRFYSGPPLTEVERKDLEREVCDRDGVELQWLDDRDVRARVCRLIWVAESERFSCRALHEEMFEMVRFTASRDGEAYEGIPAGAIEIELPMRPFFRLTRHWPVMRALRWLGFHRLAALRGACLPARLSPHLVLLSASGERRMAAIETGRVLERIWLRASLLGIAIQPLAAAPLYALPEFVTVRENLRARLRREWSFITSRTPLMLLRVGHAKPASERAQRPPLEAFIDPS